MVGIDKAGMESVVDVLIRAQAFSLFDSGTDHDVFVLKVVKESRKLMNAVRTQVEQDVEEQLGELTRLLDERSHTHGQPIKRSIVDFEYMMKKNEEILDHMIEINSRSLNLKESIESKFTYIVNTDTLSAKYIDQINENIYSIHQQLSSLERTLAIRSSNPKLEEIRNPTKKSRSIDVKPVEKKQNTTDKSQDIEDLRVQYILELIYEGDGVTKKEISRVTKVPLSAVDNICKHLKSIGKIKSVRFGQGNANLYYPESYDIGELTVSSNTEE
jgi:hypothetical protein